VLLNIVINYITVILYLLQTLPGQPSWPWLYGRFTTTYVISANHH